MIGCESQVFSDIHCRTSLIFLIKTVLQTDFKSFEFIPQEVPREEEDLKTVVYDISTELNDKTCVDIEMQPNFKPAVIDRMLYE
jgi:predicted transposase/invertase (TIGR01784 family)